MYTLLSAGVLALDLARHPSGAAVADVAERVLALTPDELTDLADAAEAGAAEAGAADEARRAAARGRLEARSAALPRARDVLPQVRAALTGPTDREQLAGLGAVLTGSLLGSLPDLHALLLREAPLRAAPPAAQTAALDAVTAAWAGREAEPADVALLRGPWSQALFPVPPALPEDGYGPDGAGVLRELLEQVGRRTPEQWQRTAAAQEELHRGLGWSGSVHRACVAALESDRLVATARAQLAAARALRLSSGGTLPCAGSAALAVTAAVQAVCVLDLLDVDAACLLLGPWEAA